MNNYDFNELAIIAIPDTVIFHKSKINLKLNKSIGDKLYARIESDDNFAIAVSLKEGSYAENYFENDLYSVGTLVKVKKVSIDNQVYTLNIEALDRIKILSLSEGDPFYLSTYEISKDNEDLDEKNQYEIINYIKTISTEISNEVGGGDAINKHIQSLDELQEIIAYTMPYILMSIEEKQQFLEMTSLKEKSLKFLDILLEQKERIQFQMEINAKLTKKANKQYRENMLRQQLKAIQEELKDENSSQSKKKDYLQLIEEANMPEEVKEVALEEHEKLQSLNPTSSETNVVRNYLELLTHLPWEKTSPQDIDIKEAKEVLNGEHYGLEKVKERVIQHLTVMKLKNNKQGSILLLVGPPGTGKTSLGKSIAKALKREYVRISLGGVRDEAEIRGHRRTYIGALPGRIIQGIKKAGTTNPVFILDEVDKLMASHQGNPSSALLEVLDPEQNNTFSDHYLEVPYDLSDVFFIGTANSLRDIPGPLRDRMEIIQINSYTATEKFYIAKNHLIAEILEEHGISEGQLIIEDETIKTIIDKYTREAGVRGLKRQLSAIARYATEKIVIDEVLLPYVVKEDMLFDILGHELARYDLVNAANPPGVVTGLAWTPVGGDILFIEGTLMPGSGKLTLTGQLGDVMKESAKISQSLIRSRLTMNMNKDFNKQDLHIHIPQGATPKDGPSAGVTLFTTIASLVTGIPVDSKIAMTGEISLRGAILPVGGIKEKVIAAHRSGIKKILLPLDNRQDLTEIPDEIKADIVFKFIQTIEELILETLGIELPKVEMLNFYDSDEGIRQSV